MIYGGRKGLWICVTIIPRGYGITVPEICYTLYRQLNYSGLRPIMYPCSASVPVRLFGHIGLSSGYGEN